MLYNHVIFVRDEKGNKLNDNCLLIMKFCHD